MAPDVCQRIRCEQFALEHINPPWSIFMTTIEVAFDESGNTGQNLLDAAQPTFALASVCLTEAEIAELTSSLASVSRTEMHFTRLKGNRASQIQLATLFQSSLISTDHAKVCIFHKRFMVTTKIVDMLVEPLLHRSGLDLYEQGANLAMSNLWHMAMPI